MWVCYLDGWAVDKYGTEGEAEFWASHYEGEHSPKYEFHEDWEEEFEFGG